MTTRRWVRVIMSTALLFAALLIISDILFVKGDSEPSSYGYRCGEPKADVPWWHIFPNTRDDPGAFWTALGSVIGIVALGFIWAQLEKTEEANAVARDAANQTKRSVDAFIEAERGRIAFVEIFADDGDLTPHVLFRNIGRGPVSIIQIIPRTAIGVEDWDIPRVPFLEAGRDLTYYPLEAGKGITSHPTKGENVVRAEGVAQKIDPKYKPNLLAGWAIFIQYTIRYSTYIEGQSFQARITVRKTFTPIETFSVVNDWNLTHEKRWINLRDLKRRS